MSQGWIKLYHSLKKHWLFTDAEMSPPLDGHFLSMDASADWMKNRQYNPRWPSTTQELSRYFLGSRRAWRSVRAVRNGGDSV